MMRKSLLILGLVATAGFVFSGLRGYQGDSNPAALREHLYWALGAGLLMLLSHSAIAVYLVATARMARRHATWAPRGARGTFPALRHRVQTFTFVILPSTSVRTTWRFGFHVRRVRLFACETLLPKATPLSQWKQRLR